MSTRYPGGLITKTPVVPTLASAPGVWTLEQALAYIKAGTWPYQGALDPYFNQTTLLLHGDGNQGATNLYNSGSPAYLAFADNSNNNFPITVNGDAYGTNISPYESNYSNFFDGSGDYLSIASTTAFGFGTGDFTIEAWLFPTSVTGVRVIFDTRTDNPQVAAQMYMDGANLNYYVNGSSRIVGTAALTINTWQHFALVKNSGTTKLYVNGAQVGSSYTDSNNYPSSVPLKIATYFGADQVFYIGYISNFRIVKGTAVYTSNFIPPTAPLTAISGTSLLTCQSNRFIDNSSNNFTITRNGDTRISPFQPFTLAANDYGSGYFDGTGDFLSVANNTAFQFGTGNFTVEFWVYANVSGSNHGLVAASLTGSGYWASLIFSGLIYWQSQNGTTNLFSFSYSGYYDKWTHVAFVRNSGTTKLYLDGVEKASASDSTNYNGSSGNYDIGRDQDNAAFLNGYMSDLRIVKGTAVYTSNFTPPTAPVANITNTSLLTCQYSGTVNNTGFIDSGPNYFPITRVGNTTQGTFSPFSLAAGEWSNYFIGTSDAISFPDNIAFTLTGDFCVECWFYQVSSASGTLFSKWESSQQEIYIATDTSNRIRLGWGAYNQNASTSPLLLTANNAFSLNTWTHLAVVRNGNTFTMYINGVSAATATFSTGASDLGQPLYIGGYASNGFQLPGYISNARIVKGSPVYTAPFTPPIAPLTAIANTVLLTCQSNRFVDNSSNNFVATVRGTPRVTPFSPFAPTAAYSINVNGGSAYFDGSGDRLQSTLTAQSPGTGDFTYQLWVYRGNANSACLFDTRNVNNNTTGFTCLINGSSQLALYTNGTILTGSGTVPVGAWSFVSVSRSGTTVTLSLNGVSQGTVTFSNNLTDTNLWLGMYVDSTGPFTGYIAGFNYIRGTAASAAIPSAPPSVVSGTAFLCNFTSAGIFDQTGKNNLETVGNAQVDTSVRKYGTGSMEFDGSGDWLQSPHSVNLEFGSGDFTVEFWAYANALSGTYTPICGQWRAGGTTASNSWYVAINAFNTTNKLGFSYSTGSASTDLAFGTTTNSTGSWNHYAVVRSGNLLYGFKDGVLLNAGGTSFTATITNGSEAFYVGGLGSASNFFNGYIDDLRITKGVARYTSNFTPPIRAFPNQ